MCDLPHVLKCYALALVLTLYVIVLSLTEI